MDNKMQIEISIKDNLSRQLAQMSENVKKAANVMKQQISAIQEAFNNIKIRTDMSKQVNSINKEIDNIGKKTKSIQINIKARLDSSGLNGLNVQDKQVKITPKVEELDLSEIENIKDKEVRVSPVVDSLDLSEIENIKDKEVRVSPVVDSLDLSEIENIKDKEVRVSPVVEELDLTEIENIKDKQVRIEPIVDNLDLSEIENIKDKEIKITADIDDDEIEKAFKNIDVEIEDIEDDFDSLDIKSNILKQIKDIIKEFNNIGNKVKDVEINIKADLDESELRADLNNFKGKVNVEANVSGLGNFKDQEIDVNANVEQTGDNLVNTSSILQAGTMVQMGNVGNQLNQGFTGLSATLEKLDEKTKQIISTGVQTTYFYTENLEKLKKVFEDLKNETNDLLFEEEDVEILNSIEEEAKNLKTYFSALSDLGIDDIRGVLPVLEKIKETIDKIRNANIMPEDSNKIKISSHIDVTDLEDEVQEVISKFTKNSIPIKMTPRLEEMASTVDQYAKFKQELQDAEIDLELNFRGLDEARQKLEELKSIPLDIESDQAINEVLNLEKEVENLQSQCEKAKSRLDFLRFTMQVLSDDFKILAKQSDWSFNLQKMSDSFKDFVFDIKNGIKTIGSIKDSIKASIPTMDEFKSGVKDAFSTLKTNTINKLSEGFKKLKNNITQTTKSTDKLKNSMSGLKGVLSKIGTFIGLYELIQFGKQAIETAANIEEAQNVIDVTFQKQANTINKWAKENASAFGLTELQAKNFAGTFGTIFQAAGVNMDYVDDMSMQLSQLAGDLASFRNLSVDDAFEKLRSGIVGSTEPLQSLGYNMSVAAMDAYLMSQGIDAAFSDLSEASKQVVRFNYIMQQTKSIQGDYANTMNSFSNSVRNLKNSFAVFSSEVGQTLIAALTPVIRVIATVIQWLTALARVFNSVLRGLGLIKGEASSAGAALGGVTSVGGGGGGIGDTSGIGDTAGAIGGIGDSADDSAESVKKLAKEVKGLMGIDEINKLPAPEEDSGDDGKGGKGGSGGPGDVGGGGGVDVPIDLGLIPNIDDNYTGVIEDKIAEMMEKIKAYLATFDWEPLKESFMRLYESIKPTIEMIGKVIKWFWDEILNPLLHFTIEDVLPRFFETLANVFNILNPILEVVLANFKVFWDEVLEPIAKWAGDKFLDFWDWLNKHLKNFGDYLNENEKAAKILGDIATALLMMWGGSKVIAGGSKVINMIKNVITWFHHLFKAITGSSIVKAIGSLFKGIGPAFSKVWGVITAAFGKIGPALSKVWGAISGLFAKIGPAFSKVWGVISGLFAKIGPALSKVWGVISGLFAKIGPLFTKLGGWLAKAGGLFTKLWGVLKVIGSAIMAGITAIATALNIPVAAVVAIIAAITAAVAAIVIYWDEICAWCKKTWNKFTKWFSKTCKSIGKWFKELWADIKAVWNKVADWFSNLFKKAWNGIKNAWSGVKKWFSNLWTGIKNIWKEVTQWFTNLFKKAWDGIKNAWSSVKKWFSDLWTGIKNIWKEVTQWFTNLFKNAWNGIKNAWSSVKKWFSDLWDGIKNIWKEVTQWFTNLFKNAWNGIKDAWSTVKQWFSDLWTGIKNIWKEVTQWFTNLFTNAWNGIKNAWASVKQWFSNLWEGIKSVFSSVGTWFSNIFTTAWNGIKNAWSGVTNWFSGIWTGIKNAFSGVGTWFSNIFASARDSIKNVWSNIKSFLTSPIESAKTAISNTINKIKGLFNFSWSLPKIKLPHFSISPPGWEFGDLLKGSIPKLGIEWYANGGIMTNPTVFGINGNNLMVGGEKSSEAIIPLNTLWEQMDKFANKVIEGTRNQDNRPIDIHNELFLDGNKVADSVIKNINKQTKLNGRSPLK